MYLDFVVVFLGFSFDVLLVMSIERYLGMYYPFFHHTSVARRRLLTLLAIIIFFQTTLHMISINDMIISREFTVIIFIIIVFPPLLYLKFKLFKINREVRRRNAISPEKKSDNKSEKYFYLFVSCCLSCDVVHSKQRIYCFQYQD